MIRYEEERNRKKEQEKRIMTANEIGDDGRRKLQGAWGRKKRRTLCVILFAPVQQTL